jgi:ankyrin repeat protein
VVAATTNRRRRADAMLAARADLAQDRWAALVLGRGWKGDADEVGGPRDWPPLHYVCHSVYRPVELARDLLERGADPNAYHPNEHGPMSALYGAAGVLHDPELTRILLEAGADPNGEPTRGDALYHACEADSTECLRLLLAHGAEPAGTNALGHALDYDRIEAVRLLLEAGADPNEGKAIVAAVRRGRGPEFLRLLAEHGADLEARSSEMWRTPRPTVLRTAFEHALLRGDLEACATLGELGASNAADPRDARVAAISRGERSPAPLPAEVDYDAQEALINATLAGHVDLVVDAVGLDFEGYRAGSPKGTLLDFAAWAGSVEVVRRLLELGADTSRPTPLGWAAYGSRHDDGQESPDYVGVAELLVAAGAPLEAVALEEADGALRDWLDERL